MSEYHPLRDPRWELFHSTNELTIERPKRQIGMISFKEHIGKPLSDRLWFMLMFQLGVRQLRIYKYDEPGQWKDIGYATCFIELDKDENVEDILWQPDAWRIFP